jgi:methionyl aminopeptidase
VQTEVEAAGYAVVRALVGHGVGRTMHEEPQVPNFGEPGTGPLLEPGIVIAIEPMVNAGGADITIDTDGWTIRTADGSLSAHAEHTVAVTENGPRILTQRAG